MLEVTIIVPKLDNAGVSLKRERASVEEDILTLAGGFSKDKIHGAWYNGEQTYRDVSWRYTVAASEQQAAWLTEKAGEWASWLRQECLYVSVREASVSFVLPVKAAA